MMTPAAALRALLERGRSLDARGWAWWIVAVGALLRLVEYACNRAYWLDELSLLENLSGGLGPYESEALRNHQLTPPLFLWLLRGIYALLGQSPYTLRLVPLCASLATLPLMHLWSFRVLPAAGALLAVALLAFSDEQIYYAIELKPYAGDVAAALLLIVVWQRFENSKPSVRGYLGLAVLGSILLGISFPICFVMATVGSISLARSILANRWRSASGWMGLIAVWGLAFLATMHAARAMLGNERMMWDFWGFAFPPSLLDDPWWVARRLLLLFILPLDYHGPFDPRWSALPALICAITGLAWLARAQRETALLVVGPLLGSLLAAALRLYPFHGRCLMFLAPGLWLAIAAGATWICAGRRRKLWLPLLVLLLGNTIGLDLQYFGAPRGRSGLSRVGDRREWSIHPDLFGDAGFWLERPGQRGVSRNRSNDQ